MVLEFLAENESFDALVVGEESDHVLKQESFAKVEQVQGRVDFGVDVVGDDVVQVDKFGTEDFTVAH